MPMTPLAICVVYLVTPDNEGLLELHLDRIARHTKRPYILYASANRLDPRLRRALEERPQVNIVPIPDTDLRGSKEHAFYLDRLVDRAVADGAGPVAILHVDSFPVRDGWDEDMAARLTPACPVAAVTRLEDLDHKPHPCGMLIDRDFYLAHRPTFRLPVEARQTPEYRAYKQAFPHEADSGVGYGLTLFMNGLAWHKLERSNRGEDHFLLGSVYGDLIFHLGAAARPHILSRRDFLDPKNKPRAWKAALMAGTTRLPGPVRGWLQYHAPRFIRRWLNPLDLPDAVLLDNRTKFEQVRNRLLANPDAYLDFLRTGHPPSILTPR